MSLPTSAISEQDIADYRSRFENSEHWTDEEISEWLALLPTLKTGEQSGKGRRVTGDVEANGLLYKQGKIPEADKLWCIGVKDIDTGEKFYWGIDLGPDSLEHGLRFLSEVSLSLFHNGTTFDYPFLEKMSPGWQRPEKAWDTLVLAKLVWPAETLVDRDFKLIRMGKMPAHLLKRHSLEAWGYRTGTHKVEYNGGFHAWRPAMAVYLMTGDLDGPEAIWTRAERNLGWGPNAPADALKWPELTVEVEHGVARIVFEQQEWGIRFDMEKARKLSAELLNEQHRINKELVRTFGRWWAPQCEDVEEGIRPARAYKRAMTEFPDIEQRRFSEKTGKELKPYVGPPLEEFSPDAPHVPVVLTTFNPGSRDHLGQRLQDVFGWKPKAFGRDGKPTVDESTLSEIPDAVMPAETRKLILDYFVVAKTIGMLSKGSKAWMHLAGQHGQIYGTESRLHGKMDTLGAVTRRGTHSDPNLSQVPSVQKEKVIQPDGSKIEVALHGLAGRYGYECKELMVADEGWEITDVDCSSLELIDLGHYLYRYDEGKFSARVCDPDRDPHQEHADLAGGMLRADAKTTIYLLIYGGSAYKLSLAIDVGEDEIPKLLSYRGLPMLLRALEKRFDADFVRKLDDRQVAKIAKARQIIMSLESGIEGLKTLIEDVKKAAEKGWLKAIDGSKIHVRKAHAALNALLQSAGAITCKLWMYLVHKKMAERGYVKGKDWAQVLWVHDALTFTHKPGLGPVIREVCEEAVQEAGVILNLRGKYRTSGNTGTNWAEVH